MGIKLAVLAGYVAYVVINLLMWIAFTAALRKTGRCITILALNSLANFGFSLLEWESLKEEDKGHQMKIGYIADEPMEESALRLSWLQRRENEISVKHYKG
ncbi:hypothetical protein T265_14649, partial [Opisthorchis viverrini]